MAEAARDWLWLPESKPEPLLKFELVGGDIRYIKDLWNKVRGRDDLAGSAESEFVKKFPTMQCADALKIKKATFYFLKDGSTRLWWDGSHFHWNCPYNFDTVKPDSYIVTRQRSSFKCFIRHEPSCVVT